MATMADRTALLAVLADYLNRADLTARLDTFVELAEADFRRRLRDRTGKVAAAFTPGSASLSVSANGWELRSLVITTPGFERIIPILAIDEFNAARTVLAASGTPVVSTYIAGTLLLAPVPDAALAVETTFYDATPALTSGAPSNALLTAHPDLYLYGALMQAAPFLEHDERIPVWEGKYEKVLADINLLRERNEHPRPRARQPRAF